MTKLEENRTLETIAMLQAFPKEIGDQSRFYIAELPILLRLIISGIRIQTGSLKLPLIKNGKISSKPVYKL